MLESRALSRFHTVVYHAHCAKIGSNRKKGLKITVCSLNKVTLGRHNYYTEVIAKDDYYREGGEAPGRFLGEGARILSLDDLEIGYKDKTLRDLFLGEAPGGQQLRRVSTTEREYTLKNGQRVKDLPNLGWDFTFSAPKSVSVLWSQGTGEIRSRIEKCHQRAVEKATEHLEKSVYTRSGKGGVVREKAHPIFGAFAHTTSRALDPQLHDHVILVNTAIRPDGRGGAVDARPLFRELHTLGRIYRNELRRNLEQDLGVRTVDRMVGREKGFEVWGVPERLLSEFSKRRASIELEISRLEKETGRKASVKEIQAITKATRARKELPDREALFSEWREVGRALGFSVDTLLKETKERTFSKEETRAFVREVSHALSYRDRITERDVLNISLSVSKGRLTTDDLKAFTKSYRDSCLTPLKVEKDGTTHYTLTREGMIKANERPRYTELRRSINRAVSTTRRWIYELRASERERRNRTFKVRITFAYALGRIDRKTYNRLTSKETPRTKAHIEFLYATHQISGRQRTYFLRKIDPALERKAKVRAARREEFVRRRQEKEHRAEELHKRGLIDPLLRTDIEKGRVSLEAVTRDLERRGSLEKEDQKRTNDEMAKPVYTTMPFARHSSTNDDKKTNHYSLINVYEVKEKSGSNYAVVYREYRYESSANGREHSRPEVIEERHWGMFPKSEAISRAEEGRLAIEDALMRVGREKGRDPVVEMTLGREPRKVYESAPYNRRVDPLDKSRHTFWKTSVERIGSSYSVVERKYEVQRDRRNGHERVSGARAIEEKERGVYRNVRSAIGVAVSQVEKGSRYSNSRTTSVDEDRKSKENDKSLSR